MIYRSSPGEKGPRDAEGAESRDSSKLHGETVGVAEAQQVVSRGRQYRHADRGQFAADSLAVEGGHPNPEPVDVRHLACRDLLQPQPGARGREPEALRIPIPSGLLAEELAVELGRPLQIWHVVHDVVQADRFTDRSEEHTSELQSQSNL